MRYKLVQDGKVYIVNFRDSYPEPEHREADEGLGEPVGLDELHGDPDRFFGEVERSDLERYEAYVNYWEEYWLMEGHDIRPKKEEKKSNNQLKLL